MGHISIISKPYKTIYKWPEALSPVLGIEMGVATERLGLHPPLSDHPAGAVVEMAPPDVQLLQMLLHKSPSSQHPIIPSLMLLRARQQEVTGKTAIHATPE